MKRVLLIVFLLKAISLVYSQERITRFTLSIVDTSQTELQQSKSIYDWLIHHVKYDTKQLENGIKYYTPEQTLRRRKATCYGYSELMYKMCESVGIESYIILGYSKGFGYIKPNTFIKSNHSWNIIKADSNLIITDPTWGSGSIKYNYDFWAKLKNAIIGKKEIETNPIFIADPNEKYFNISPSLIIETHFPLDSKWQLLDYPLTYKSYISETIDTPIFLNFRNEISYIAHCDLPCQAFDDAINSIKYNPDNKFDIAFQYYSQANSLKLEKKMILDSTLLYSLEYSLSNYNKSLSYLAEFKLMNRLTFNEKKLNEQIALKNAANSIKKLKKIPAFINNNYEKSINKQIKKESFLNKKSLKSSLRNFPLFHEIKFTFPEIESFDSLAYIEYTRQIERNSEKIKIENINLEKLAKKIVEEYESGISHTKIILEYLNAISILIQKISQSLDSMNEFQVLNSASLIYPKYQEYNSLYSLKKNLESALYADFTVYLNKYEIIRQSLFSNILCFEKLAKLTGDNNTFSLKANETMEVLNTLHQQKLITINFLKLHNKSWKELLTKQDEVLSVYGFKGLDIIKERLNFFSEFMSQKNKLEYSNNLNLCNSIKTYSQKRILVEKEMIRQIHKELAPANKQ